MGYADQISAKARKRDSKAIEALRKREQKRRIIEMRAEAKTSGLTLDEYLILCAGKK
jgi:hypothetical protein